MRGLLRFLTVTAIVMVIGSSALATPSVTLTFDPVTYMYTYHVVLTVGSGDDINQFTIDAFTESGSAWTMANVLNLSGTSGTWLKTRTSWGGPPWVAYRWYNGSANRTNTGWIGEFKLTIPDSHPADGKVAIKPFSTTGYEMDVLVPRLNSLPEPGTLMGIGAMLLGMAPILIKIRKK